MRAEYFSDSKNRMREVDALILTCAWTLRSTVSAVTGRSPGQLACNQGMIMGSEVDMSWSNSRRAIEKHIAKNNELGNKKRTKYQHQVGDCVKTLHRKNHTRDLQS